jgi:hypothetical protein
MPFDALPLIRRETSEPFLQKADVELRNGKRTNTTMGAPGATGDLAQEGGIGPFKPMVCFPRECWEVRAVRGLHGPIPPEKERRGRR